MKSRRISIAVLSILVGLLGNIVASQLQESLGNYVKLVWVPFVIIAAIFIFLELREQQQKRSEHRTDDLASPNRRAMIEKVRAIWITGVLNRSLYKDVDHT